VKIKSGPYDVLYNGVVEAYDLNQPISFYLTDEKDETLVVNFSYKLTVESDEIGTKLSLSEDQRKLFVDFVRKSGTTSFSNRTPVSLGTFNNRRFFLNYTVVTIANEQRWQLTITLYLGEGANDE
jgi:hypothetical protein